MEETYDILKLQNDLFRNYKKKYDKQNISFLTRFIKVNPENVDKKVYGVLKYYGPENIQHLGNLKIFLPYYLSDELSVFEENDRPYIIFEDQRQRVLEGKIDKVFYRTIEFTKE